MVPIEDIKLEELNFDEYVKDVFTFEDYKKNLKSDTEKFSQNFKNILEKSINDILAENRNNVKKNLDLELSQYLKDSQETIMNIKNSLLDFSENMSNAINEWKESIEVKEFILSKPDVLQGLNNDDKNNNAKKNNNNNNIPAKKKKKVIDSIWAK